MKDFAKSIVCNTKAEIAKVGNYKPDYKDVTDQELKNWIRMNEQDIREYTREAKKYEKFGSRPEFKGSYDASQYGHAIGEIEDRKEKIKWMQDELARRKRTGNSKVGNIKDDAKAKALYKEMMDAKDIAEEWGRASNYQKKDNLEGGRKAAEEAYRKAKKAYEDYAMNKKTGNAKVGNTRTGNETLAQYVKSKPRVINEEKTGAEEFSKQLSDDAKKREEKDEQEVEKLVENSTVSEYNAEIQRLTRKAEQLRRMGQGKSAMEVEKQIEKLGKELAEVGNFKTGKSALKSGDRVQSYGVQGTVRKVEGENSDNIYGEPIIEVEWDNGTVKKVGEHYLRKIGNKVGNSASDDKFAYVMREFDEGKLKTPDGKVVTDPAQAKAIAYSESKKTENGLARARNAMAGNKKAIGSYFIMNNYGIEVGQWSWEWKNGAPDKKTMDDTARKIKDYVRQIDKNVPDGDNDERDEVFAKLDRFMHSQGLK